MVGGGREFFFKVFCIFCFTISFFYLQTYFLYLQRWYILKIWVTFYLIFTIMGRYVEVIFLMTPVLSWLRLCKYTSNNIIKKFAGPSWVLVTSVKSFYIYFADLYLKTFNGFFTLVLPQRTPKYFGVSFDILVMLGVLSGFYNFGHPNFTDSMLFMETSWGRKKEKKKKELQRCYGPTQHPVS